MALRPDGSTDAPDTRYARSGDVNIAYQMAGDAPRDFVLMPGWVSNIEVFREEAACARFLERLASFARLILAKFVELPGSPQSDRVLATVVFTDIVEATQRSAALEDRPWRDLLEGRHGLVRRELERFRGREIDTAGDGVCFQDRGLHTIKGVPGDWHLFALEPERGGRG